jgi:thiosulfate dehydrogenase
MGPMATNPDMRFAGNNLACKNCHLDVGTRPGAGSWVGVVDRFPQFRGRENKIGTIEERINGCIERSMNGKVLPVESHQMKAIVAYMDWLGDDIPEQREKEFIGFAKIEIPETAASPVLGKAVYISECQVCHGDNGQGMLLPDSTKGYLYPPLWGKDSYNHGAGMHRVLTAAQFIKGNMPWGLATVDNPKLTDEESYHVAAYINSFDRPLKNNAAIDFPDRKLKPVSTPYGPWDDNFSREQHKYGPFGPILDYYESEYGITKTK